MRKLKFRAWDGKKMYLPEQADKEDFHLLPDGTIVETHEEGYERHEFTSARGENWIVMQYTGMTDIEGNDIYEGDICMGQFAKQNHDLIVIGTVIMDEYMWCLDTNSKNGDDAEENVYPINRLTDMVVIGNIYEHMHLLEQKKSEIQ